MSEPQPGQVQVSPGPVQISVQQVATPDGKVWAVLQCATVFGVQAYFLEPEVAAQVSEALSHVGAASRSGLYLAGPGGVA